MSQFWRSSSLTGIVLFLETCGFYLIFRLVTSLIQLPNAGLPFWLVLLALAWAYLLSLYLQTIKFSLNLRGGLGLGASVLSILVLSNLNTNMGFFPIGNIIAGDLKTAFTLVFSWVFLVLLWWRGASIAQDEVTLDNLRGTFQWCLAVVFAAVLIDALPPFEIVNGFLILGFFGVGLAGLSLARFASDSSDSRGMPTNWLLPIGISVGLVLLLGLIVGGLGMGGMDDLTRGILGFVGTVGGWILRPILLGLGFIAAGLVALGNWLTGVFGGGDLTGLQEAQQQLQDFHESLGEVDQRGPPRFLVGALKWGAFLGGATLVGFILYRLFRFRPLVREVGEVEEVRESLFSWQRANDDLSGWLNSWWGRLVNAATGKDRRLPAPKDPREVYHRFLGMASVVGRPKAEAETPREHQRGVGDRLPIRPSAQVVDSFQETHYGDYQVSGPEMERLLVDWEALERFVIEQQRREKEAEAEE